MAIPLLNDLGLLPAGIHECTPNEVVEAFCGSPARVAAWQRFQQFLQWAETKPKPVEFLVDGSFVTDKVAPSDIDVAVDISGCSAADQNAWIVAFAREHKTVKQDFRIDFYPFGGGLGSNFAAFFQYVRIDEAMARGAPGDVRKGILRLLI